MSTAVQRRRGTTAQHASFAGLEGELTVDTTKDTLVVHDGATTGGRPLLREDQSNLPTSAPTTGIYNASGSLAISTNGTGRLFVDESGNVVIGQSIPTGRLTLPVNNTISWQSSNVQDQVIYADGSSNLRFSTAGTERLRITSDGRLGLGTSSPWSLLTVGSGGTANPAATTSIHASTHSEFRLKLTSSNYATAGNWLGLGFGFSDNYLKAAILAEAQDQYGKTNLHFCLNNSTSSANASLSDSRLVITPSGNVGVGTTTPGSLLEVYRGTIALNANVSGDTTKLSWKYQGTEYQYIERDNAVGGLAFGDNTSERMRLDTSGRLLVGTSSALGNYHQFNALSTASNYLAIVGVHNATNDDVRGIYSFAPNCTTADGFFYLGAVGADVIKFAVRTDGDVQNVNNSYGAYSDVRLKENIVDAASQWDDIKNLQVRKYNYKENTGHATHTQIGLIAQEVELVSPGLVGESQAEPLGDSAETIKTINYSVLYMKAVKALQEAMERIETLEAKVAALETP